MKFAGRQRPPTHSEIGPCARNLLSKHTSEYRYVESGSHCYFGESLIQHVSAFITKRMRFLAVILFLATFGFTEADTIRLRRESGGKVWGDNSQRKTSLVRSFGPPFTWRWEVIFALKRGYQFWLLIRGVCEMWHNYPRVPSILPGSGTSELFLCCCFLASM